MVKKGIEKRLRWPIRSTQKLSSSNWHPQVPLRLSIWGGGQEWMAVAFANVAGGQEAESALPSQLVLIKEQPVKPGSAVGSALCFEMKKQITVKGKIWSLETRACKWAFCLYASPLLPPPSII